MIDVSRTIRTLISTIILLEIVLFLFVFIDGAAIIIGGSFLYFLINDSGFIGYNLHILSLVITIYLLYFIGFKKKVFRRVLSFLIQKSHNNCYLAVFSIIATVFALYSFILIIGFLNFNGITRIE